MVKYALKIFGKNLQLMLDISEKFINLFFTGHCGVKMLGFIL